MSRRLGFAIVVILAIGVGLVVWFTRGTAGPSAWQGYAEADYVKVGPVQQGQLTAVSVSRGDAVIAGAPLFAQDDTSERAARDQAARQLAQAEEQLANLQSGAKPTEIQLAQANLADAHATLVRADADLKRGETLLPKGAIAAQAVDQLRAARLSAQARVQATEAALAQSNAPLGRDSEIKGQRAAVDAYRALVQMADWRLQQRHVSAPIGGRVADVLARPGETLNAGAPVVSLLPAENVFIRFFVPESALASIHRGDTVALRCDSCPPDLSATISFISPQAEYTPPVIYSESSRAKLVYLIEAKPRPDQAAKLNPGQPIEVSAVTVPAAR